MSSDRTLTFNISSLPRSDRSRGNWRAMFADLAEAFMQIQALRDDASDLARIEATLWAMKSATALHQQVVSEAATHPRRQVA